MTAQLDPSTRHWYGTSVVLHMIIATMMAMETTMENQKLREKIRAKISILARHEREL